MSNDFVLPQTTIFLSQTAASKLRRTELGRSLLISDEVIVDRVKFDPDDPNRIWIGTRKTAISQYAMRTLHCSIDNDTYNILQDATADAHQALLSEFAVRLYECFAAGRKQCPFITEPL